MKRSSILIIALTLIIGLTTTSYANVYATNLAVSATTITTGATNTTVEISFLLNEDADSGVDVKIYSGATLVRTLTLATATKGSNSVVWDGTDAGAATLPDGDYTFEVTAADDGHTEWTKISDPLKTVMYSPKGISVNMDPMSEHFGKVYVSNGYPGTSTNTGAFYNGDGVFMFNAAQDSLDFSDAGLDWSTSSDAPGESTVGENDQVFVSHTGSDLLYSFDASISSASAIEVLGASNKYADQGINSHFIHGTGADRVIYTASEAYAAVDGITMYDLGTADVLPADYTGEHVIERPNGSFYQNDVVVDAAGNIYICQKRFDPNQAIPLIKYPPYTGTTLTLADALWSLPITVTGATSLLLDEANGHILWGDYYSGDIYIHDMATGAAVDTIVTGQNRNNEIVFDAAGNLYSTDNSGEYWNAFSAPDGANSFTTPGLATISIETPAVISVVINEVGEPYNMTGTWNDSYVELYNTTDAAIDVSGWVLWSNQVSALRATSSFVFPTGTSIAADGYLVATRDRDAFLVDYGTYVDAAIVPIAESITNSGVYIADSYSFELLDGSGASIDATTSTVDWNSSVWEKNAPTDDGLVDDNWHPTSQSAPVQGTPGALNSLAPTETAYTIVEIQTPDASGDVSQHNGELVETSGIITALTSYSFYMQDGIVDYSGIYVYVSGDVSALALGDNVTVNGTVGEYNGLTQVQSITNVTVNSSGNDLPAPIVLVTNTLAEGHEGMLVNVSGNCTAVSTDAGGDRWAFKVDDGSGDALIDDQLFSDAENVATVGSPYDVLGVVNYYYGAFTVNPRDIDDIEDLSVLPSIVAVKPVSDTEIDVMYSMDLAVANLADYSITGTSMTLASATLDIGDSSLVHLVASAAIIADVIADTLIDAANADTVLLYAGISPIAFTNALNPGGTFDLGIPATFTGLVIADDEYNNVWVNDAVGGYNGVLLYDYDIGDTADVGDLILFTGDLDVYYNLSELKHIELLEHTSSDNPTVPSPITGADIDSSLAAETNPAEQWEGQLVSIDSALILSDAGGYRYELTDDGGVTKFLLGDDVDYHFSNLSFNVGSMYNLTGVVSYLYGYYVFSPRNMADVVELDIARPELAGVVAVSETQLQLRFSEPVASADALTLANYAVADDLGSQAPTVVAMLNDYTYLLTVPAIVPNKLYTVTVNGIHDLIGNEIMAGSTIDVVLDIPGEIPLDRIMNDFVDGIGNWTDPNYSGSTYGIEDPASTFASSDSMAFAGTHSGEMVLLDDPTVDGGWFVRLWNLNRVDRIDADSKMFFYLYGGGADIQARIVVKDDGGYEAGPWHDMTHAETDWQVVSIDLENDVLTGWLTGNGTIEAASGTVAIDGLQIRCSEDVSVNLYLDMVTERYNIDPVEVTFDLDMGVQALMENFDPSADFVDVAGNMNGWGDDFDLVLEATGADTMYTITLTDVYPGETLEYKFRINGSWSDDTAEFPYGGPARVFLVPDTDSTVFHYYNDIAAPVGINGIAIPTEYALHDNYPNPFNPITNIKYDIPENTHVTIAIYNTLGQHVVDLVNEEQAAGYYHMQWNGLSKQGTPVSSGLYVYRLTTSEFTQSEKMTFLK
jgi:flagellar hook assembly protein FlgD